MAKIKWTEEAEILKVNVEGIEQKFDVTKIFKGWDSLGEVERHIAVYGLKQKLSDILAGSKESKEVKSKKLEDRFQELVEGKVRTKVAREAGIPLGQIKALIEKGSVLFLKEILKSDLPLTEELKDLAKKRIKKGK